MRKLLLAAAMALCLAGCASTIQKIEDAYTVVTQARVSYKYALVSVTTFNTLQTAGEAYLRLPTCTATSRPVCHERKATKQIIASFTAGRIARDAVLAYIKNNPCDQASGTCPLMPQGVTDALEGIISTLKSVYTQYNVTMRS